MNFPKISILVPIYNAELYLKECLLSLINQTYKSIEIICIDDGSRDNSGDIVKHYMALDHRITLISQENRGLSAARNAGLKIATGEYIMFCDSDDYFQLDAIELCVREIITHNCIDGIFFNARMFSMSGTDIRGIEGEAYETVPLEIVCDQSNFLGGFGNVCFGCFSLSIIKSNNLTFREGYIYEDWDFVVQFSILAKKIYWLNHMLYNYRWAQTGSLCGDVTIKCLDIFITMSLVEKYLKMACRWENNQYSFYIKALGHILYFKRERLIRAKEDVKKAFDKKAEEFVQAIPYTMLCSLVHFFPMADRVALLKLHKDHDVEVEFCMENLKRQRREERKQRIKSFFKGILMKFFPAYRVAVNTRREMEQMHGELMGKLNEVTWLQYENRKDIDLIMRKLGMNKESKLIEEILVKKEHENYIK